MTDHDALINAVLADPDDDVARLVFADFVEEAGDPERAAFIRAQIELARTPPWEPFAVRCSPDYHTGDPWRSALPWADSWSPRRPYRRGFGYAVQVQAIRSLLESGDELFASAPVEELHLPGGSMDEYRLFAQQPWLPKVRSVRFWTLVTPMEPIRALTHSPLASGLESIRFDKASSPGMAFLIEDLFASHIGRQLKDLSFHVGGVGSEIDLIQALSAGGPTRLEKLTIDKMSLTDDSAEALVASPVLDTLRHLTLSNLTMTDAWLARLLASPRLANLQSLVLSNIWLTDGEGLGDEPLLAGLGQLRHLDLSRCYQLVSRLPEFFHTPGLAGLRSLRLREMNSPASVVDGLLGSVFWDNLTVVDLSGNAQLRPHVRRLREVRPESDLLIHDE